MDCLDRYRDIVSHWEAFRAVQSPPLVSSARINTLKTGWEELRERLAEQRLDCRPFDWYPLELKLDVESPGKRLEKHLGFIHIQEEFSMVPPLLLDPSRARAF